MISQIFFSRKIFIVLWLLAGTLPGAAEVWNYALPDAHCLLYVNCGKLIKNLSPQYQQFIMGNEMNLAAKMPGMTEKDEMLLSFKLFSWDPVGFAADGVIFSSAPINALDTFSEEFQKSGGIYDKSFRIGNEKAERFTLRQDDYLLDCAVSSPGSTRQLFHLRYGSSIPVGTPLGKLQKSTAGELIRQQQCGVAVLLSSPAAIAGILNRTPETAMYAGFLSQLESVFLTISGKDKFLQIRLILDTSAPESAAMFSNMLQPLAQQHPFFSGARIFNSGKKVTAEIQLDLFQLANIKNIADTQKKK